MLKERKASVVEQLGDRLRRANLALVSEYRGMTAAETTDMRRKLRAVRGELRVAKNTLIRRALEGTPFKPLAEQLGGSVGIILSFEDPIAVAKTVGGFRELGDKFKVRGGVLDGRAISSDDVQALAALPSREIVLAQLLGLIQAPATHLVRLLNEPASALVRVIDAIGKKNGAAQAPAEGAAGA